MDFKRILRTPVVWVVLIFGIGVLWLTVADSSSFTRIDTSAAEKLINDGTVTRPSSSVRTRSSSP